MHSETQRARFIIWIFIFLSLAVGAGLYWFWSGEYQGQAAEKINASKETVMTNTLIGYWTLDGSNIVWGDTTSEIKDVNPGTKHHGNSTNLAAGSAVPGRTGQGLLFNGSSDTVSLGNVYNGVKTVAFWVKPNTTTQSLIDLNATATVDINAGMIRGNNFTTPTIYINGAPQVANTAPTLVDYQQSDWTTQTAGDEVTPTVTWQAGDLVLVFGSTEAGTNATLNTPTATGLSFSLVTSINTADFNDTANYLWSATAGSNGSGAITATRGDSGTNARGIAAFVYRGSNGLGNTATLDNSANKAISLTRGSDNSATAVVLGDWNAVNDTTVTSSPGSGTQRVAQFVTGAATSFLFDWGDQGATGTTSYGIGNHTGTVDMSGIAVEVRGTETGDVPLDTAWHHIAVTTGTGINANAAYIGQIASSYFGGILDDIRFYSDALTATQVADLYRASGAKEVSNANHREALTDGLVGYWTFDGRDVNWGDTSTEIKDISGNANHGAVSGLTRSSVTPGKLGQALSFDGSGDYVNAGDTSSLNLTSSFSISFWVNGNSFPGGYYYQLLSKGSRGAGSYFLLVDVANYSEGDQRFRFGFTSGGSWSTVDSTTVVATGTWWHIAGVFDDSANTLKVYVNEALAGTSTGITSVPGSTTGINLTIGAYYNGDYEWINGKIDDVRLYNRALSVDEVSNLYDLGK